MNLQNILFKKRITAYKTVFDPNSPYAEIVWADLRNFCKGTGSKWMGNTEDTLRAIGRNEVFERIRSYTQMDDKTLMTLMETIDDE